MRNGKRRLAAAALTTLAAFHATVVMGQSSDAIRDLPGALENLSTTVDLLTVSRRPVTLPSGGHLQGIQIASDDATRTRQVLISHDSLTEAYLAVVELPGSLPDDFNATGELTLVQKLPSDGQLPPLRHAGGFQLVGKVLAIGVEDNQDKKRSQIQFWSIDSRSRLDQLVHLTIARSSETPKETTAGAVGLIERENDFLLAVGNWDCRAIDFYLSNAKSLADVDCRFEHKLQWKAESAATDDWKPDSTCGAYQSLNFVRDRAGAVYLLGFETTPAGQDVIDLFDVDLARGAERSLRKIARKVVTLKDENHFRYGGGVAIRSGKLVILSTERNFRRNAATRLNVLR